MTNPLYDPYLILSKVYREGSFLKQALSSTPVERLNRARTVKIAYGVLEKDFWLDRIIAENCEKPPRSTIKIILKIALYMLEYLGKHDYMTVDYAVELTKKLGKEGAAGFVNAFLRAYRLPEIPQSGEEKLALESSTPLWLVKKLKRSYKGEAEQILKAKSLGVSVRFERNAQNYLDYPHIATPFYGGYIFKNFVRDGGFFAGDYTFQSVGSQAICHAVAPAQRLLDACAAPGGKSVLLSKKCGEVVACELHTHRVALIEDYKQRMGADNVRAIQADSSLFNPDFEEGFDAVLVDAPCSGTGVINENPDIKYFRREEDIAELTKIQLEILKNCARYVKSGGRLYYSTCSVLPEENDSVIYNFLNSVQGFELEIPTSPLEHVKTKFGIQFLPHISLGAGFFMTALIRR